MRINNRMLPGASSYILMDSVTPSVIPTIARPSKSRVKGLQIVELDGGKHTIVGAFILELSAKVWPQHSAAYFSPFVLPLECSGGSEYEIKGKMVTSDLTGGIELWIEEVSTGTVVSRPTRFPVQILE